MIRFTCLLFFILVNLFFSNYAICFSSDISEGKLIVPPNMRDALEAEAGNFMKKSKEAERTAGDINFVKRFDR